MTTTVKITALHGPVKVERRYVGHPALEILGDLAEGETLAHVTVWEGVELVLTENPQPTKETEA